MYCVICYYSKYILCIVLSVIITVNTIVNMTFQLKNLTMTSQLQDPNSAQFKAIESEFCLNVSIYFKCCSMLY